MSADIKPVQFTDCGVWAAGVAGCLADKSADCADTIMAALRCTTPRSKGILRQPVFISNLNDD
jgi:hypothetical protein